MSKNNKLDDMTMNGPVGKLLPRKEKKTPSAADNTPRIIAKKIILLIRSTRRYAVAAGIINMAETRTTPTACNETTIAAARNI